MSKARKSISDILDELYEIYEEYNGVRLKDINIAKELGIDKTTMSAIKNGKRQLRTDEVEILADFFGVPEQVITGKMDISEIPTEDKHGLRKLSRLSRKWIYDSSKNEQGRERVKMLNRILSSTKTANLLFDTLYAYTVGIPIRVSSLNENYKHSDIEKILYKELILTSLDEFFDDIYRKGTVDREKRTEEQVNEILNRMKKSRQILKQEHEAEDKIALQIKEEELKEELIDGLREMIEDNSNR